MAAICKGKLGGRHKADKQKPPVKWGAKYIRETENLEFSAFFEDVLQASVDLLELAVLEARNFLPALVIGDAGLLASRELDDVFELTDVVACELRDNRTGKNTQQPRYYRNFHKNCLDK